MEGLPLQPSNQEPKMNFSKPRRPSAQIVSLRRSLAVPHADGHRVHWLMGGLTATAAAMLMLTSQAWAQSNPAAAASAPPAAVTPGEPAPGMGMQQHRGPGAHGPQERADMPRHGKRMHAMPGMLPFMMAGPHADRHAERLLKRIKATDEQRASIKKLMSQAREQQAPLFKEGRALHDEALKLWGAPEVDAAAVEQLRMRMNAHHQRMTEVNSKLFLEVARILTPQQRQEIVKSFQDRKDRHEQRKGGAPR